MAGGKRRTPEQFAIVKLLDAETSTGIEQVAQATSERGDS